MAVYTPVDKGDLDALLVSYDLGRALDCRGIEQGIENSNFDLAAEAGRFILTLYEKRAAAADLPYFLDLMAWLSTAGFSCPTPIADRAGRVLQTVRERPAALVTFLPGSAVADPTPDHCREAGAALARLHLAGRGFPGRRRNALGLDAWRSLFDAHGADAEDLRPGLAAEIASDLDALQANWPKGLPEGSIHADLFPDNVFFDAEGRFSAAIDFYFACDDLLAYDLAVMLTAWAFDARSAPRPDHARALVDGYDHVRSLRDGERVALPVLARGAAMRFFLTRLADLGSTPKDALVRPKDPMEYEARLAAFRDAPNGNPFAL